MRNQNGATEATLSNEVNYVREVTARYIGPRLKSPTISSPNEAAVFMRKLLRDEAREHFFALYLNGAHQVVSFSLVSLGTANFSQVHCREVFQGAVLVGACAIIVGHNHPSGKLIPSNEDIAVTRKLAEAGKILGIPLLDHVLLTSDGYVSFKEQSVIE